MYKRKIFAFTLTLLFISNIFALKIPKDYKFVQCKLAPVKGPYKKKLHIKHATGYSTNWSGYAALTNLSHPAKNSVSYVEGSWRVPKLRATPNTAYSSAWVGIDGFTSSSVEQLGTEHDWYRGKQYNYAWFEMYPAPENRIGLFGFPVKVGDSISASVNYVGSGIFVMTIINHTKKVFHIVPTKYTKSLTAKRSSAEWIMEAPCCTNSGAILPLANFNKIYFSGCKCTIKGSSGSINNKKWQNDRLIMINNSGALIKALTSSLTCSGKNFNVTWKHQ